MTGLAAPAAVGVAFAFVVTVVVLCATFRPGSAGAIAKVLHALAEVFAAMWPRRR